jgi:hypothetical protein
MDFLIQSRKSILFLGKIWERNQICRLGFRPICPKKFAEFFRRLALIFRESVRISFRHAARSITQPLFLELVRDSNRVHCRRIRMPEPCSPKDAARFSLRVACSMVLSFPTIPDKSVASIFGMLRRSSRAFSFLSSTLLASHGLPVPVWKRYLPYGRLRIPLDEHRDARNHDAPLLDLLEKTDPLGKITLAINNHPVPSCRLFLDPFPVPQPANVSEVGGN